MHVRAAASSRRACVRSVKHSVLALSPSFVRVSATSPMATFHTHVSALVGAGNHPKGTQRMVLVKVGTGEYSPISLRETMNRSDVLKALKRDDIFANHLKDVPLDQAKVWVLRSVAGDTPTAKEEQDNVELDGIKTVASIIKTAKLNIDEKSKLVLRVELPTPIPSEYLCLVLYLQRIITMDCRQQPSGHNRSIILDEHGNADGRRSCCSSHISAWCFLVRRTTQADSCHSQISVQLSNE
jgi:hypothetical protein